MSTDYPAPKKQKRRPSPAAPDSVRFDPAVLTDEDHALLAKLAALRGEFQQLLDGSNILYHLRTCPACGFPTLEEGAHYEVCLLCLWEDSGLDDGGDLLTASPPNYEALLAYRVNVAHLLEQSRASAELAAVLRQPGAVLDSIRVFRQGLQEGTFVVDTISFDRNLRQILGLQPGEGT